MPDRIYYLDSTPNGDVFYTHREGVAVPKEIREKYYAKLVAAGVLKEGEIAKEKSNGKSKSRK